MSNGENKLQRNFHSVHEDNNCFSLNNGNFTPLPVNNQSEDKVLTDRILKKIKENKKPPSLSKTANHRPTVSRLSLNDLSLLVHLGCSAKERSTLQEVTLSVEMEFFKPPLGEKTDQIEDTFCYGEICNTLKNFVKEKHFHLIEKMARECLSLLRKKYPLTLIRLTLHKKNPPIEDLSGGVKYTCGEEF